MVKKRTTSLHLQPNNRQNIREFSLPVVIFAVYYTLDVFYSLSDSKRLNGTVAAVTARPLL